MAKWDNMLSMLWMLRSGRKLTAAQIADSLEISVRTVYRYIDALCASGVPVVAESGHDGGIRILESFKETPLFFNSVELKALVDAFKFARGACYPYTEELESALKKVENGLHEEQRHDLSHQTSGMDVISPSRPPSVVPLLRELEQSAKEGRTVRIAYRKANVEQADEREVDPYGLAFDRNEWYAVAFCHQSQTLRTFRVDRISRLEPTEARFEKPERFSTSAYFRNQSEREREADGPLAVIRIEGEPDTLNALCGHWHLRHYLTERTDREARFLIDVPTMNKYLPMYLMTFGTAIRIREPLELKRRIQEMAYGIAKHYENDPD
ncbi:helix-turn-helix transcriptional regulator [Paenibacillus radicis (ex Xue et al. 2023)]|uniref:YafY family transcriptional regulator n=1 Tax=Paenibacillus radicis (ex Xue et al. 2023) TaxID=2972489 RepID=A0ABT1YFS5_9BACL|nr:YafY family protein [Paenibacillus radicis (ex Xue et al. 2023)]MCR8632044.1 YafY family transcriptional regulator [Paenibacillus radicis (ex Xue et al. 2023)]